MSECCELQCIGTVESIAHDPQTIKTYKIFHTLRSMVHWTVGKHFGIDRLSPWCQSTVRKFLNSVRGTLFRRKKSRKHLCWIDFLKYWRSALWPCPSVVLWTVHKFQTKLIPDNKPFPILSNFALLKGTRFPGRSPPLIVSLFKVQTFNLFWWFLFIWFKNSYKINQKFTLHSRIPPRLTLWHLINIKHPLNT